MRIVAVQAGLSSDSVLGGSITDCEFLVRLANRGRNPRAGRSEIPYPIDYQYMRRGWLAAADVLNTRSLPNLRRMLAR